MNGLILYKKQDYDRNSAYITWMQEAAKKKGCHLQLMFLNDFFRNGLSSGNDFEFVINRSRSYEASLILELNNIRVFNNSLISLLGNNKLAAYKFAKDRGFCYPKVYASWLNENSVLSKPNSGHGGYGISMLDDLAGDDFTDDDWSERFQQEYIKDTRGDVRFYIINNKIIHAVLRRSDGKLVSNFSQGGVCELFKVDGNHEKTVYRLIEGLSIDYAGVDFLVTSDGKLIFNEIEDAVGSRMLSHLGINNTTDLYILHIIRKMGET